MKFEGGCQCSNIRFTVEIENNDAYLCHCRYCQKASGNVSVAFKNVLQTALLWHKQPAWYQSSLIARRGFCSKCGTPLAFQYIHGEYIDLTVGSFDNPSYFKPSRHFGTESRLVAWEDTSHLPQQNADDYEPLKQRWEAARKALQV